MSIHWPIIRSLLASPTRIAVVDDMRSYRAVEILVAAMHVAAKIKSVCDTSTVAFLTPTCGASPIIALAGWMLGKTVVPLNFLLKPEELQYVIDDCGTDTVVTIKPMLDAMGYTPRSKNLIRLEDISFKGMPEPIFPACPQDEDLALLLYTSGTSGKPKGVMLSHGNINANIQQVLTAVSITKQDVMLGVLPQFHSFGLTVLTLVPLSVGLKVVYTAKFFPAKIVKLIREHQATIYVAIASMWSAMLSVKDAGPEDFASLRLPLSGGEPLSDATSQRIRERFGVLISEGYGLTETAPVTNLCQPHQYKRHSVGPVMPGMIQRIADLNTGAVLGPNEDGEIQMTGPNVMQGYFNLPNETQGAFTKDGFFRSGDIGHLDDDGFLFITGRLKEMIIIGGENVFPREIEEVLNTHESIAASGVVGIQDPIRGELPVAFVELRDGATFNMHDVASWCRGRLAGYKVPKEIHVVEALPKNPTGKIMRRELKNMIPKPAR